MLRADVPNGSPLDNDPWAKGNNRGFASRANRVQIESDTPQTVKKGIDYDETIA